MIHIKKNHKKKTEATSLGLRATEDVSKNKDKKDDGIWYRLFGRFDYEKNKKDISQSQRGWEKNELGQRFEGSAANKNNECGDN